MEYLTIKNIKVLIHAPIRMNFENMPNEMSVTQLHMLYDSIYVKHEIYCRK